MENFKSFFRESRLNGKKFFFYSILAGSCIVQASQKGFAQTVSLTTPGVPYTQNFDALANAGTTNTLTIPGWYLTESGGGSRDNEQYGGDNGASNTGDCYSYGASGSNERALGALRSGTLVPIFGAAFTNNTGSAITSLNISYTGEEWRSGTAARTDMINFEYSLNASDLTTGTWTSFSALNFTTPNTAAVGGKDGNAAAYRTALSATISSLSIANGATVWIRWTDTDASGADDGLSVDDFSLTPIGASLSPEINVLGNSVSIVNNDALPSLSDFTDFGNQSICSGTVSHTFTIQNTGTASLTLSGAPVVAVSGTNASDFTVSVQPTSPVTASGSTTFTVVFNPSASGLRTAVLTIANNDSNENPYSFSIQGTGLEVSVTLASQANVSCFGGANGSATVSASGGTPSYTYSWAPAGGTGATATGLAANTYTCTITDAGSCTKTQTVTITEPPAITATISASTNISCFGGANGTATVSASGGTPSYTYSWAPAGGTAATATGLAANTYTCTITDGNTCTQTQTVTITEPTAITATISASTNVSCFGGSNGTATVSASGGTPSYTYSWAPAGGTGVTATGLAANTYTCTITDANTCTQTQTVTITEPTAIAATISASTNVSCFGESNGTATISASGGTPSYTYSWAPAGGTAATATGLTANTYTCTITDGNTCSQTQTVTITEPTAITATISASTNVSCFGGANGSATISASGGTPSYTYSWAPAGGTAATASGLAANTYTCTITDANTCSQTQTVTITEPTAITATISASANVSCFGGSNGTATVSVNGGMPSYSYSWAPTGGTGATASGLAANTYTCTITDANTCTQTQTISITEPTAIIFSGNTQTDVSCFSGSNGTASVNAATGGTGAFVYDWIPGTPTGDGTISITNLTAGTYDCIATDNNGCNDTASITITEPAAALAASAAETTSILCNSGTADVTVSATGGTLAYTGTGTFTETAGTYNYTVTDANGCTATTSITITEPATFIASASATTIFCNGETADITVSATGGTTAYTGTGTFTVNAGTYTYTVSDANGCTAATSISVTEPAIINVSQTIALCAGETLTVGTATHSNSGMFTDTIVTINGCDSIVTSNLTISPVINVSTSLSSNVISADLTGATAYQWIDCDNSNAPLTGETAQSYTAIADGDFAVVITQGSCSDTSACVTIVGTGINPTKANRELSIYPNPANDVVTIQVENSMLNNSGILFLYNSTGQLISKTQISSVKTEIGISSLPKGIYFITLHDQDGVITKKITKQ